MFIDCLKYDGLLRHHCNSIDNWFFSLLCWDQQIPARMNLREKKKKKCSKRESIFESIFAWDINQNVAATRKLKENQYVTIIWNLLVFHLGRGAQAEIARRFFVILLRERFIFLKWNPHRGRCYRFNNIRLREMSIFLLRLLPLPLILCALLNYSHCWNGRARVCARARSICNFISSIFRIQCVCSQML